MAGPGSLLARDSLMKWIRTPGFLMVVAVALVPPALTGAWMWTHQDDVAVAGIEWTPASPESGDLVNFTVSVENRFGHAVDAFNVTLRVGFYQQDARTGEFTWSDRFNETQRVEGGLGADETKELLFNWTAVANTWQVEVLVDWYEDVVKEEEPLNNYYTDQIQVRYPSVRPQIEIPEPAANETNSTAPVVNATIGNMSWTPAEIFQGDNVTFNVDVVNRGPGAIRNGTLQFQVWRLAVTGTPTQQVFSDTREVDVEPGGSTEVSFEYAEAPTGLFAAFAFVDVSAVSQGDNESDNALIRQFDVQNELIFEEPGERETAKSFYRNDILLPVHFALLVPLIGLFYAGGVLQDDRTRGNLVYMLSRPVPRWQLPIVRFGASFGVALVAVLVGIVLTYLIILGGPSPDASYLWWPLVFGVVVLFLYGAVFTLVGVVSDRPYLVGLLYVLGFETLVLAGRRVLVNGQPLVQEWVLRLSLYHWVRDAFSGWDPSGGFSLLPQGSTAVTAFLVIIGIGVASLALAGFLMQRREFVD